MAATAAAIRTAPIATAVSFFCFFMSCSYWFVFPVTWTSGNSKAGVPVIPAYFN
jgi:hypothetical protein